MRMIQSLPKIINDLLLPLKQGSPPPHCTRAIELVEDYLVVNWSATKSRRQRAKQRRDGIPHDQDTDVDEQSSSRAMRTFVKGMRAFFAVVNGDPSGNSLEHFCLTPECCQGNKNITVKKILIATIDFMFVSLPDVPNWGKWTKTGPCLDRILPMLWIGNLLGALMPVAFSRIQVSLDTHTPGEVEALVGDASWHELAGKRLKKAMSFVAEAETCVDLTIMAIVLEPLRHLTGLFLSCGRLGRPGDLPALVNLVSPSTSLVYHSLQYYSMLLSGHGTRLELLWRLVAKRGSYSEWLSQCPQQAWKLRRAILCAATWVHRRHQCLFEQWPWPLARLVDHRLDHVHRTTLAREFFVNPCVDPYFGLRLKTAVGHEEALMQPSCQQMLLAWARQVRCSICRIEFQHASNRSHAHENMLWHSLVAKSMNVKAQSVSRDAVNVAVATNSARSETMDPEERPAKLLLKKQSLFELVRKDCIDKQAEGHRSVVVGSEHWAEVRSAVQQLSAADREHYQNKSDRSADVARANRNIMKRKKQGVTEVSISSLVPLSVSEASPSGQVVAAQVDSGHALAERGNEADGPMWQRHLFDTVACSSRSSGNMRTQQPYPMSVDAFESVLEQCKPQALVADFKDKCKRLSFDAGAVPEKVSYIQPCGGACKHKMQFDSWRRHLHGNVVKVLFRIAAQAGKPAVMPCQDMLLAFELSGTAGTKWLWAFLCTCSRASGSTPARVNLVGGEALGRINTLEEALRDCIRIRMARLPFVQASRSPGSPWNQTAAHGLGALLSYTEDTLATVLVEALLEKPSRVVVHSFRGQNKLVGLDTVALSSGERGESAEIPVDPPPARKKKRRRGSDISSDDEGNIDYLASDKPVAEDHGIISTDDVPDWLEAELSAIIDEADLKSLKNEIGPHEESDPEDPDNDDFQDMDSQSEADMEKDGPTVPNLDAVPVELATAGAEADAQTSPTNAGAALAAQTPTEVAAAYGLTVASDWSVRSESGQLLGKLRMIDGHSMKATCQLHGPRCHVMLNGYTPTKEPRWNQVECDLLTWLAGGLVGAEGHAAAGLQLRAAKYGMRVKPRRDQPHC